MANQSENPQISPDFVGRAFADQYYNILKFHPDKLHQFYHEESALSRPGPDGKESITETTMQGINNMVLSLDYKNYQVEILSIDSQSSVNNGVIVLVTGNLVGIHDNVPRGFTQTFFLAPQQMGYFVLNDIFRYVDDQANNFVVENAPEAPLAPNHVVTERSAVADQPVLSQTTSVEVTSTNEKEVNDTNGKEANNVLENGQESVSENIVVADNPVELRQNVAPQVTEAAASSTQNNPPKMSYASVVTALKEINAPISKKVTPSPKPVPVERPRAPVTPDALPPRNNIAVEKNNVPAAKAHAIFVAQLPMNATVEELEKIFKQFGPIKRDGIQVRSNKDNGSCFGFVEFESANSMQNALKASVHYGERRLNIEERRASNERGRFPSGRGGYRNDNYRSRENNGGGRGNYGGGRDFGRNDSEKRGENRELSGQTRGNGGRNGEAYQNQKPAQNGGKVARQPVKAVA